MTLLLAFGLVLAGCADTNDRGVIVNKPFDIFGAVATPANQPVPAANPATASLVNNV